MVLLDRYSPMYTQIEQAYASTILGKCVDAHTALPLAQLYPGEPPDTYRNLTMPPRTCWRTPACPDVPNAGILGHKITNNI